jgi:ligand-binding sensor domain-containing protein
MNLSKKNKFSLLLIYFLITFTSVADSQTLPFGHISVEEGLSNSFVNCVIQDRTGFLWFGTDDGLNRFDGYELKVYRNNPDDKGSISENIIWALWEDYSGNIWIGTKTGGLNKYDPVTDKFKHWDLDSESTEEINITNLYEDSKRNIWIGT